MSALIFIPIIFLHIFEAWYDATFGDRHIVPIFVFQLLFGLFIAAVLPFTTWWQGVAAFVAVRIWFDYVYNAFKGLPWYYLGTTAQTDIWFRNFDAYGLFVARVLVFCGSLIIFNT